MKVGDLVQVVARSAAGGVPKGAIGIILEEIRQSDDYSRFVVRWVYGNHMPRLLDLRMKESTTYGNGLEVISESI